MRLCVGDTLRGAPEARTKSDLLPGITTLPVRAFTTGAFGAVGLLAAAQRPG